MKELIIIIMVISIILSFFGPYMVFGTDMAKLLTDKAFENDTWLVIDNLLINKLDGTVSSLKVDRDATITGNDNIYYHGPYAYKYVFEKSSFMQYTSLKTFYYTNAGDPMIMKETKIVDFDENGIYTVDSKGRFCYIDFETKKSELIYDCPGSICNFSITDEYICVYYHVDNNYYNLIYQKGGTVIADELYPKKEAYV